MLLQGNHEGRIARLIEANPGLSRLRAIDLKRAAELPERWHCLRPQAILRVGHLTFLHGDLAGGGGGKHAAYNMLQRLKTSFVCGHFHRHQEERVGHRF